VYGESTLYMRQGPVGKYGFKANKLLAALTLHVNGLGIAGTPECREWTYEQLEKRFGQTPLSAVSPTAPCGKTHLSVPRTPTSTRDHCWKKWLDPV
jgi:hypothetical protein